MISKKLVLLAIATGVSLSMSADALTITPDWTPQWNGDDGIGTEGQLNPLSTAQVELVLGLPPGTLEELYKSDGPGNDSGDAAAWYNTSFLNDFADADIEHVDGQSNIDPNLTLYAGVKNGNHSPYWYVFELEGWDGTDTLEFRDFWPEQGSISHVSIFGGAGRPSTGVPDFGATSALLGLSMLVIGSVRRRLKR